MKKKIKIVIKFIKKYLPDIFILIGIWIFAYNVFFPIANYRSYSIVRLKMGTGYDYSDEFKFLGIILFTLGIDIAIRRYLAFKKINP